MALDLETDIESISAELGPASLFTTVVIEGNKITITVSVPPEAPNADFQIEFELKDT